MWTFVLFYFVLTAGKLTQDEDREIGAVQARTYKEYLNAAGGNIQYVLLRY